MKILIIIKWCLTSSHSHSSFDFNIFAFNPWELYTQGYF